MKGFLVVRPKEDRKGTVVIEECLFYVHSKETMAIVFSSGVYATSKKTLGELLRSLGMRNFEVSLLLLSQ